jgi:hypothetical protein
VAKKRAAKKPALVTRAEVVRCIEHYRKFLGLSDWQHKLVMDMSGKGDAMATVVARPSRRTFCMVFAPRCFADGAANEQTGVVTLENTVLHELLHVLLWPLVEGIAPDAQEEVDTAGAIRVVLEEPIVDPLARVLARYLPKPPPPKKSRRRA